MDLFIFNGHNSALTTAGYFHLPIGVNGSHLLEQSKDNGYRCIEEGYCNKIKDLKFKTHSVLPWLCYMGCHGLVMLHGLPW